VPEAELVTLTAIVQALLVATVPPVSEILPVPLVATTVPPQASLSPFGVATSRPLGNESVNATPVSATVLAAGLVMAKVKAETPFTVIDVGLKAFVIDGGATTVSVAVLLLAPAPPSVELIVPVVLDLDPAVVPVTSAENVHVEPVPGDAVRVPPARLILALPAVAVMVPLPQVPVTLGVEATVRPAGKVSVKVTPLRALALFGLLRVKLSEVLPFNGMVAAPNALLIVGGPTTRTLALEVFPVPPLVELT